MKSFTPPVWISALWLSLTIVIALFLDASPRGWLLATVIGVIPCGVLLKLWKDDSAPTMAEAIRSAKGRQ